MAWNERDQFRPLFDEAYRYSMPGRNLFTEQAVGARRGYEIYDSTLQICTQRFANRLQSVVTPPDKIWADLIIGRVAKSTLKDDPDTEIKISMMLHEITSACFALMYTSNFNSTSNEFYLDLGVSTGVILVKKTNDLRKPISFTSVPLATVAIEDGADGGVGAVFRKLKVKPRYAEETWVGFKKPPQWEKKELSDKNFLDEEICFVEATYKEDGKWYYCVFEEDAEGEPHKCIDDVLKINPWIVCRWTKLAGESFGRGPVLSALPDAKVANKTKEYILKNAALAIAPPLRVIDDGVMNLSTIRLVPGALIPVSRNSGALGPSVDPLVLGANFEVGDIVLADLQANIKKIMLDDDLPDADEGVRSATEYMARLRKLQNDVGSPFGRLNEEWIRPLFNILVHYLGEMGTLQKIMSRYGFSAKTLHVDGIGIDVEVKGPMAMAQTLDELDGISTAIQMGSALGMEPMLYSIKIEDLPRMIWQHLRLDPAYLRTEEEKQAMMAKTAQAAQQAEAQGQLTAA